MGSDNSTAAGAAHHPGSAAAAAAAAMYGAGGLLAAYPRGLGSLACTDSVYAAAAAAQGYVSLDSSTFYPNMV